MSTNGTRRKGRAERARNRKRLRNWLIATAATAALVVTGMTVFAAGPIETIYEGTVTPDPETGKTFMTDLPVGTATIFLENIPESDITFETNDPENFQYISNDRWTLYNYVNPKTGAESKRWFLDGLPENPDSPGAVPYWSFPARVMYVNTLEPGEHKMGNVYYKMTYHDGVLLVDGTKADLTVTWSNITLANWKTTKNKYNGNRFPLGLSYSSGAERNEIAVTSMIIKAVNDNGVNNSSAHYDMDFEITQDGEMIRDYNAILAMSDLDNGGVALEPDGNLNASIGATKAFPSTLETVKASKGVTDDDLAVHYAETVFLGKGVNSKVHMTQLTGDESTLVDADYVASTNNTEYVGTKGTSGLIDEMRAGFGVALNAGSFETQWEGTGCGTIFTFGRLCHVITATTYGEEEDDLYKDGGEVIAQDVSIVEYDESQNRDISTINPKNTRTSVLTVPDGQNRKYIVKPKAGYAISEVKVDGNVVELQKDENGDYYYTFERNDANHQIDATFTRPRIEKKADLSHARKGDVITYTITATNEGRYDISDLLVSDELGDGLKFISAEDEEGNAPDMGSGNTTMSWDKQRLPAATDDGPGQKTYTVKARVMKDDITEVENTTTIKDPEQDFTDPKQTATVRTPITKIEDKASIRLTKEITGRKWNKDDEFRFKIDAVTKGAPMPSEPAEDTITVKMGSDPSAAVTESFGTIYFTQDDMIKATDDDGVPTEYYDERVFEYDLTEISGNTAGLTYDDATHKAYVKVTAHWNADTPKFDVTVTYDGDSDKEPAVFTNTYRAQGSIELKAEKVLEGRKLKAGEFTFNVVDEQDQQIYIDPDSSKIVPAGTEGARPVTAKNDTTGKILFPEIRFDESDVGTMPKLGIVEVIPEAKESGMEYSTATHSVKIQIRDNGDGTLDIAPIYGSDSQQTKAVFTNTYKASGSLSLTATKTLNGRALNADGFTFYIYEGKDVVTGTPLRNTTNKANGEVNFGEITYDQDVLDQIGEDGRAYGEIWYTIVEKGAGTTVQNVAIDSNHYNVQVIVRDKGNGELEATPHFYLNNSETEVDGASFLNTYSAETTLGLNVCKTLEGRSWKDSDQFDFNISIEGSEGAPMPEDTTLTMKKEDPLGADEATRKKAFEQIRFSQVDIGKTYTYTIKELKPADTKGIEYDESEHQVQVEIGWDQATGELTKKVNYLNDPNACAAFTNTYRTGDTRATIQATKKLTGREWLDDETYTFNITATRQGVPLPSSTDGQTDTADATKAAKTADFGAITFSHEDLKNDDGTYANEKEFFYTLTEQLPEDATVDEDGVCNCKGITYETQAHSAKVLLKDNGDGTLSTEVTYKGEKTPPVFNNTYKAKEVSIQPTAMKRMVNRDLKEAKYSFEMVDMNPKLPDGKTDNPNYKKVIDNATTDTNGVIVGHAITYTQEGSYTYSLREVIPDEAKAKIGDQTISYADASDDQKQSGEWKYQGVTYDSQWREITVTVTDDHEGQLLATVAPSEPTRFTNTYHASGQAVLKINKEIKGREWKDDKNTYTFDLTAVSGNDADGAEIAAADIPMATSTSATVDTSTTVGPNGRKTATFDAIKYTEQDIGKTFTYMIKERDDGAGGVTYDLTEHTATVTVSDGGDGTLHLKTVYDKGTADAGENVPTVINEYKAEGSLTLRAQKNLDNMAGTTKVLNAGEFEFGLYDGENRLVGTTKSNEADGSVTFDPVTISVDQSNREQYIGAAPRRYYVKEILPEEKEEGVTYDSTVHSINVSITDNGDGTLTLTPKNVDGQTSDTVSFTNTFGAKTSIQIPVHKELRGRPILAAGFSFKLVDKTPNSDTLDQTLETTNVTPEQDGATTADGAFTLNYEKTGTYIYEITEIAGANPGVTYDDTIKTVAVVVSGDDTLVAELHEDSASGDVIKRVDFMNTYRATGSATAKATKKISGRDWQNAEAYEFAVRLTAEDARDPMPSGQKELTGTASGTDVSDQNGNKTAEIKGLTYQISDLEEYNAETGRKYDDFYYDLVEVIPEDATAKIDGQTITYGEATAEEKAAGTWKKDGIVYSKNEYRVWVHAEDNTEGKIETTVKYGPKDASKPEDYSLTAPIITNRYEPEKVTTKEPEESIKATKNLTGRPGDEWLDGDSYTFTIQAEKGTPLPAEDQRSITVTKDSPEHQSYFGQITYTAEDMADANWAKDGTRTKTFNYLLKEQIPEDAIATIDGEQKLYKDATDAEKAAATWKKNGVTYTNASHAAHVTIKDDGYGKLTVESVKYFSGDSAQSASAKFTNIYEATPAKFEFKGTKEMQGRNLIGGHYSFRVFEADETYQIAVGVEALQASIADGTAEADGSIGPYEVTYDHPGTYYYVIREVNGGDTGVKYDLAERHVKVVVTDNGKGELKITEANYDNSKAAINESDRDVTAQAKFTNKFEASTTTALRVNKSINGREWNDGEQFTFSLEAVTKGAPMPLNGSDGAVLDGATATKSDPTATFSTIKFDQDDLATVDEQGVTTYELSKTFVYKITEDNAGGSKDGLTYSTDVIYAHVKLEDEDGTLTTAVTYSTSPEVDQAGTAKIPTFTNVYEAETSTDLAIQKILNGAQFQYTDANGDKKTRTFQFQLFDKSGATVVDSEGHDVIVSSDADGKAKIAARNEDGHLIPKLNYTQEDIGKEYQFGIREIKPTNAEAGMNYSTAQHSVKVYVKYDPERTENNGLYTEVIYSAGDHAEFINDYKASGAFEAKAKKVMEGRSLDANGFTFDLYEGENADIRSQLSIRNTTNTVSGDVNFGEITFTQNDIDPIKGYGEKWYTIVERTPADAEEIGDAKVKRNVTYDQKHYNVKVVIEDQGDGKLKITPTYYDGEKEIQVDEQQREDVFTNVYKAKTTAVLKANKKLEGREWADNDSFEFKLEAITENAPMPEGAEAPTGAAENVIAEATKASPTAAFDEITYTEADLGKTYDYKITEVIPEDTHDVNYDGAEHIAHVKIDMITATGELKATITYDDAKTGAPSFTNVYEGEAAANLEVTKTISGGRGWGDSDEFTFQLEALTDGAPLPKDNSGAIDASASATKDVQTAAFEAITFTSADIGKTYRYKITEQNAGKTINGLKYSTESIDVSIAVGYDIDKRELIATITYNNDAQLGKPTITNRSVTTNVHVTKLWNDDNDRDGMRKDAVFHLTKTVDGQTSDVGEPITIKKNAKGDELLARWETLPTYEGDQPITYGVREDATEGYEQKLDGNAAGGFTMTNTHVPEVIDLVINKKWSDGDGENRPDMETFKNKLVLMVYEEEADGYTPVANSVEPTVTVDPADPSKYLVTYAGLPKYADQQMIQYAVYENAIDGYVTSDDDDTTSEHQGETDGIVTTGHTLTNWANGDLKTITRTITYRYINENGKLAEATVEQHVTFERTGHYEGGQLVFPDWSTITEPQSFVEVNTPTDPLNNLWETATSKVDAMEVHATDDDVNVTVVYTPKAPTGVDKVTYGPPKTPQKGTPDFVTTTTTTPLSDYDGSGDNVGPNQIVRYSFAEGGTSITNEFGSYELNTTTGEVTFTPVDDFTDGAATPVTVVATDANGMTATATYTPNIADPAPPNGNSVVTYGPPGQTQTGTPTFELGTPDLYPGDGTKTEGGNQMVSYTLMNGDTPVTTLTVPYVGTYTIDPTTGTVTFVPENGFIGSGNRVPVRGTDKNGLEGYGYYTPNVIDNIQSGTSTRTISYFYDDGSPIKGSDGQPLVKEQVLNFRRTGTVDPETGEVTWDDWVEQTFEAVPSPEIDKYVPDRDNVGEESVIAGVHLDERVVYTKKPFRVHFDPNGGEGHMDPELFEYGEKKRLDKNTFTREGYTFKGWKATVDGKTVYFDDMQEVLDLINESGEEVTLYAIWEKVESPVTPPQDGGKAKTPGAKTGDEQNLPLNAVVFTMSLASLLGLNEARRRRRHHE